MYHTEHGKWPIGNNIQNTLDFYMDHPLNKTARDDYAFADPRLHLILFLIFCLWAIFPVFIFLLITPVHRFRVACHG